MRNLGRLKRVVFLSVRLSFVVEFECAQSKLSRADDYGSISDLGVTLLGRIPGFLALHFSGRKSGHFKVQSEEVALNDRALDFGQLLEEIRAIDLHNCVPRTANWDGPWSPPTASPNFFSARSPPTRHSWAHVAQLLFCSQSPI